jgi:hypothetical protein
MKIPTELRHLGHPQTRATAIADWEVGLPRLNALYPAPCADDHANHRIFMHEIGCALIGMSVHPAASATLVAAGGTR